jgi:hypothetical protein
MPAAPDVLIYKRTHPGDPDGLGQFGIEDCMGRVRNCRYDFIIGVGGVGGQARSHGLNGKVNWVARWPKRRPHPWAKRGGDMVIFAPGDYAVMEDQGPPLNVVSPKLARRVYGSRNRFLNTSLSAAERQEAARVVNAILSNPGRYSKKRVGSGGGCPPKGGEPSVGGCGPRRCSRSGKPPRSGGC